MAITFIPEVWSATMLTSLKKELVFAGPDVANRNYEGDIRNMGDTVRVRSMGRPTVASYVKGSTSIVPEQLTDAQRSLVIDQAKYFAFEVDDIDTAQSPGGELDEGLTEAVYALRDVADQYVAGFYSQAASANAIGTVSVTTAALAYTQIRRLKVALDKANVPQEGRYVIVPPWYHGLLLEDARFVDASSYGSTVPILNGEVGRALGFKVLMSNNVVNTTGDDWAVMAGIPGAIAFAEQINKVETYRPQDSFSDAVKGLHVYGAKVMRPDALATVIASES
jgi:N4-gp56 family major capsid protein